MMGIVENSHYLTKHYDAAAMHCYVTLMMFEGAGALEPCPGPPLPPLLDVLLVSVLLHLPVNWFTLNGLLIS